MGTVVLLLAGGGLTYNYMHQQSVPTVVSIGLHDGQKDVSLQPSFKLTSSRPLTTRDLQHSLRVNPGVDSVVRASGGGRTFTWTPRQPLAELTEYTVSVASQKDSSGHRLKAARWRFTTTIVPRVLSLVAEGGGPVPDQGEILAGTRLAVGFNDRMDPRGVQVLADGSPVQLTWSGDARSVLFSGPPIPIGRHQLSLAGGSKDSEGRAVSPWSSRVSVVYHVDIHTTPMKAPALVQVPNDPAARDQSGLQAADAVYEYLTEGDITRFTAVFTHAPDVVGPIRSGRLISFALTRHMHGMLFMSGLSSGSSARLAADPVPSVVEEPGIFYRTSDRVAPNNLFVGASSLQQNEDRNGLGPASLEHGPAPWVEGEPAPSVSVPEHRSTYSYDQATGTYLKNEEGHEMSDASLGQPLKIQLLVLLRTTAQSTGYVEDVNGVQGLEFDMQSGGRADFYFGGRHASGKWSARDRDSPLTFQLDSGEVVKLPQGLAWIDVLKG